MYDRKKQLQRGLIQVHVTFSEEERLSTGVGGESLWAFPVGNRHAQIASAGLFCEISMDDIVQTELTEKPIREYVKIVKKNTNTYFARYSSLKEEDWENMSKYFLSYGIRVDGVTDNLCVVSVPVYFPEGKINDLVKECPFEMSIYTNQNDIPED